MIAPFALVAALALAEPTPQPFRTSFDPGTRWLFGAGWHYDPDTRESRVRLEHAWLIRDEDVDDDRSSAWKLTHALGAFEAAIGEGPSPIAATLYRGEYLRWSRDGGIVIPTQPPMRLGLPLDLGLTLELGHVRTFPESDKIPADASKSPFSLAVGAIASEIVFDFWRSRHVGSSFVLAIGPSYDLWFERESERVRHVVAPFSRARLAVHHEWCQGKQVFDASVDASTAWESEGETWVRHVGADLGWEWTFLALNDRPLSLRIAGRWSWDELLRSPNAAHQLTLTTGLRLGL